MAIFMLDTTMCIYLMKQQPEQVARRFEQCYVGDVVMSAITFAELEFGVAEAQDVARERKSLRALIEDIPVVPFDETAAIVYGPIRESTRNRKKDQLDKLIASHAIALGLTLVTNNERDFLVYPGLKIVNWFNE